MPTFFTNEASFNNLEVSGSTIMSASNSALTTRIIGSGSNILVVSGSTGGMLTVTDTINSSIFSVSSGSNKILDVSSVAPYLFSVSSGSNTILAVDSTRQVIMNVSGSATTGIRMLGIPNQTASFVLTYISESGVVGYTTASFSASYALGSSTSITSSYPIWVTGSTIYSTGPVSTTTPNTTASIFLGVSASYSASNTPYSIFLGNNAGWQAYTSQESNFIGASSGYRAYGSRDSNFIGTYAGYDSNSSSYSNLIGYAAGYGFNNVSNSNFIGTYAGYTSTSPTSIISSNFIGTYAGANNSNASLANFIGSNAGQYAYNASGSNFIGYFTGYNSPNAAYSNLIGYNVANSTGTGIGSNNIIIGTNITLPDARRDSINIGGILFGTGSYSTITGNPTSNPTMGRIGINITNPIYNLDVSGTVGFRNLTTNTASFVILFDSSSGQLFYTASNTFGVGSAITALTSSYPVWVTGSTLYSTGPLSTANPNTTSNIFLGSGSGFTAFTASNSNFFGQATGRNATFASQSNFIGGFAGQNASASYGANFIGYQAGQNAPFTSFGTFIGHSAGQGASSASYAIFIGQTAGGASTNAIYSNFIGTAAGYNAANASYSNFIGINTGQFATNAQNSNFIGTSAGYSASNANNSNFIGYAAGYGEPAASYSTLIGYKPGYISSSTGIGSNNIIIGTNITLDVNRKDSINIGGIIFGTGSYSTITDLNTSSFSGSANGRIGINIPIPAANLHVGGTTFMSSSADLTTLTIQGSGSALETSTIPLVFVTASRGDIMTVWDRMSGSLFEVNLASGDPVLQVRSDNIVKMGIWPVMGNYTSYRSSIPSGSLVTIYTIPVSSSNAAFFDYVIISGSNIRAGNFITSWGPGTSPNNITYIETSTHDIGNTSFVTMSADISSNQMRFRGGSSRGNWEIRTIIRYI